MKTSLNKILITSFSGLGICAVAMPALQISNHDLVSYNIPVMDQRAFPGGYHAFHDAGKNKSEYTGSVVSFRSHKIVATKTGMLRDWIIKPGSSVSESDTVALVSTEDPSTENTIDRKENGADQLPLLPSQNADAITKPDKKLLEVLLSPAAGELTSAKVAVGDSLHKGSTVALVIDQQYSILKFAVNTNDFNRLEKLKGVEIRTPRYPGERFIGLVKSLDKHSKNGINQVGVEINNLPDFIFQPGIVALATFRFPG